MQVEGRQPLVVHCVADLIEAVTELQRDSGRVLWFRGQRDVAWDVAPSIYRRVPGRPAYSNLDERNLTNRFRSRAAIRYSPAPSYDAHASWLSLMQHYGLPTRLLDWSRSPMVAAYFAVEHCLADVADPSPGADAVIWVLRPHALNQLRSGTEVTPSIDANMCKDILAPAFTNFADETGMIMAVMAAETDLRMFVQQGCFTMHSDRTPLNQAEQWERFLVPLLVPATAIEQLAREVDACGFRQGDIYPDLGHLAQELRHTHPAGWAR
jgi:hypothetical protein